MAVPKRRTTPSKKGHRRSHHGVKLSTIIRCSRCSAPIERHTICSQCGYYRGRPMRGMEEEIA